MILDLDLLFDEDFTAITTAATTLGLKSLDMDTTPPDQIGNGNVVCVRFQMTTGWVGGVGINFNVIESAFAALTSPTVVAASGVVLTAQLGVGAGFNLEIPIERLLLRYLGVQYVSTGTFSAGAITAGIWLDQQTSKTGWTSHAGFN